jgi:tRNA (guanine37-N1)-methyltransferase
MAGLLEGPVYTRPRVWRGRAVPPILLSGDHAAIARWRRDQALRRTVASRPDLVAKLPADALSGRDREVLAAAARATGDQHAEAGFPVGGEDVAH